jgi:8-demethyltetracenomycin C L-rhamnosyltransferase
MRVLLATLPELSHALPAIPLAWALRAAGAEVLVASGGDVTRVTEAGLPFVDLLPGRGLADVLGSFDLAALADPGHGPAVLAGSLPEQAKEAPGYAGFVPRVSEMLPGDDVLALLGMMHGIVGVAERWRPDVIVHGPLTVGALVAAEKLGIPAVEHGFGFLRTERLWGLVRVLGADVFDRHGVDLPAQRNAIDVAPPSMLDGEPDGWSMRYIPYNGGATVPAWLAEPPAQPRVAVTLGNLVSRLEGWHDLARRIFEPAAEVDAEFVLAVGDVDVSDVGPVPTNVRVVGYTPLTQLLPTCAAVVHHGGAGTSMGALDVGIPQLVIPQLFDHQNTAERVVKRGVGLACGPDLPDGILETLVVDGDLREGAREVRAELRTLPTPVDLSRTIVELAGG